MYLKALFLIIYNYTRYCAEKQCYFLFFSPAFAVLAAGTWETVTPNTAQSTQRAPASRKTRTPSAMLAPVVSTSSKSRTARFRQSAFRAGTKAPTTFSRLAPALSVFCAAPSDARSHGANVAPNRPASARATTQPDRGPKTAAHVCARQIGDSQCARLQIQRRASPAQAGNKLSGGKVGGTTQTMLLQPKNQTSDGARLRGTHQDASTPPHQLQPIPTAGSGSRWPLHRRSSRATASPVPNQRGNLHTECRCPDCRSALRQLPATCRRRRSAGRQDNTTQSGEQSAASWRIPPQIWRKPCSKPGVAHQLAVVLDHRLDNIRPPDNNHHALRPRHGGIEQIAGQQHLGARKGR